MRAHGIATPVTEINEGAVLVAQGAVVREDGSHRQVVTAVRRTAANTWLTINGAEVRYSNRASVLVEAERDSGAPLGKPTYTGGDVRYRAENVYGHRR